MSSKGKAPLMTVEDVALRCHIHPDTVRRMTDRGATPKPVRLGRAVRYREGEIESWISEGCPSMSRKRR